MKSAGWMLMIVLLLLIEVIRFVAQAPGFLSKLDPRQSMTLWSLSSSLTKANEETSTSYNDFQSDIQTLVERKEQLPKEKVLFILRTSEERLNATRQPLLRFASPDRAHKKAWMTIVGDLHGQLEDLLYIFNSHTLPSVSSPYIFLGDLVDRGDFGLEIVLILLLQKLMEPSAVHILRGNHETRTRYNFRQQVLEAYDEDVYAACLRVFDLLPLAAVMDGAFFLVHGGIPDKPILLTDLEQIQLGTESMQQPLVKQLVWNDPILNQSITGTLRGRTGGTFQFGQQITTQFLTDNNLKLIVRSHEVVKYGFELVHKNRVMTLFSAPNIEGLANLGAYLKLNTDMSYDAVLFQGEDDSEDSESDSSSRDRI